MRITATSAAAQLRRLASPIRREFRAVSCPSFAAAAQKAGDPLQILQVHGEPNRGLIRLVRVTFHPESARSLVEAGPSGFHPMTCSGRDSRLLRSGANPTNPAADLEWLRQPPDPPYADSLPVFSSPSSRDYLVPFLTTGILVPRPHFPRGWLFPHPPRSFEGARSCLRSPGAAGGPSG